MICMRIQKKIS